ncbi:uncharacterized protein LOC128392423 [Panonychus citri]|uniref:uncharacterized protein LOC128392423 n=1 Tax=Panonychus citri TaxID=50023 RepID=UPI002307977A|nr:uncharacterized protein LOC128392423 [Panonychus citri]XP_053208425.1 uncharacterized protein LOC128392423 [Panonychus citri]XP_053208426.1 uncharacterized protein LOC128392423 [Panonychus citri]
MPGHYPNRYKIDVLCVRKVLIMLVQLIILTSYSSLIWFCEAHAPLHRIYYGPHRFNPSLSSSSSSSSSSLASSPTIDLSLFGNRFVDPQSSSSEPNPDRTENDLYSQFSNSVNSIPSCNQLKYLWKEANRLAINLYGPDFAFSHPKLHANPFYLTNLLLRKHNHHTHSFGGEIVNSMSGSGKGVFVEPEPIPSRFQPVLVNPAFGIVDNNDENTNGKSSNDIYSEVGEFGSIKDRLTPTSSLGQNNGFNSPVPGQFSDYSIPKNDLGAIYGNIVMSPDQLHHSSPTSSSSSQLVTSTPSPSSRKDAGHKPKLGFGAVLTNSKEIYDSNPDESSHRSSESSKKVDNLFNLGFWHDAPVDLS